MKTAPSVSTTTPIATFFAAHGTHEITRLGGITRGVTDPGLGEIMYCQRDHAYFVDKGTLRSAPSVTTAGTIAVFLSSHQGHQLTHIGPMAKPGGGEFADAWYCQNDHAVLVDITS